LVDFKQKENPDPNFPTPFSLKQFYLLKLFLLKVFLFKYFSAIFDFSLGPGYLFKNLFKFKEKEIRLKKKRKRAYMMFPGVALKF